MKLLNARDQLKFRNEEEFGKHPEPKSQDDLYEKMQGNLFNAFCKTHILYCF